MKPARTIHTDLSTGLFWISVAVGSLALAVGVGIPLVQAVGWLRTGIWQPFPTAEFCANSGIPIPEFSGWVGARHIANLVWEAPFSLVGGIPMALVSLLLWNWSRKEKRLVKTEQFELRKIANWPPPL
jgi:hypothetical protein